MTQKVPAISFHLPPEQLTTNNWQHWNLWTYVLKDCSKWLWTLCIWCNGTVNTYTTVNLYNGRTKDCGLLFIGRGHEKGWNSQVQRTERKFVVGRSFVAQQCLPSFCCPYQGTLHKLKSEAFSYPPDLAPSDSHHLDPWRRLWKVTDLQMATRWRKWYMTGSALNQKSFIYSTRKLVDHCTKKQVDYRKKWYISEQINWKLNWPCITISFPFII